MFFLPLSANTAPEDGQDASPRKRGYQEERRNNRKVEIIIDRPLEEPEPAATEDEIDELPGMRKKRTAMQLRELEEVLASRDINGLYDLLHTDNVVLKLDSGRRRNRVYSREQAILLLKKKWGKGSTTSFRIVEYIGLDSVDETPRVVIEREFAGRPGGVARTEKIFMFVAKSQGRWIIIGIRVVPR